MRQTNRRTAALAAALLATACGRGPKSHYHDYTTPENATRSFLEAGRVGDMDSVRRSVVAAERAQDLHCDYSSLESYELELASAGDDEAVVLMVMGPVKSPLACVREQGEWKVTIHGSLRCMQEMMKDPFGASPR